MVKVLHSLLIVFDEVLHQRFLRKLRARERNGKILNCKSWLSNRQQRVIINSSTSEGVR